MTFHTVLVWSLLTLGTALVFVCAIGVAVMDDPYQRLHYIAPPTLITATLFTIAAFVDEPQKEAGLKAAFATVVLIGMNGVVTHATARAARIRERDHWMPTVEEQVPIVGQGRILDEGEGAQPGRGE